MKRSALAAATAIIAFAALTAGCGAAASSRIPLTPVGGAWAPDSHSIARAANGGVEIFRRNGRRIRLIHIRTPTRGVSWTDGGKTLLFVSKEPHQKPDRTERVGSAPHWSPDGSSILFTLGHRHRDDLWVVDAEGGHPRKLVSGLFSPEASWSPDGSWIAVSTFAPDGSDKRRHLYIAPASGGALRQLTSEEVRSGGPPAWTPDGKWITYATLEGEVSEVSPDGLAWRRIADFPHQEVRDLAWSPDGSRLAYTAEPIIESD